MKKRYNTPECLSVNVRTAMFIANSYGDDQGSIRYDNSKYVSADDGD